MLTILPLLAALSWIVVPYELASLGNTGAETKEFLKNLSFIAEPIGLLGIIIDAANKRKLGSYALFIAISTLMIKYGVDLFIYHGTESIKEESQKNKIMFAATWIQVFGITGLINLFAFAAKDGLVSLKKWLDNYFA